VTVSPEPKFSVSPATHNFGNTNLGATSAAQSFTVRNNGLGILNISGVSLTGADSARFTIGANTCTGSLVADATCTVDVTFSPTAVGVASANLRIAHDAPGSPDDIALSGTGVGVPAFSVSPTAHDFGNTDIGQASSAQDFVVQNTGSGALNISSVTLTGTDAAQFAINTSNCNTPVAASGTCTVAVSYSPSDVGAATATLSFAHNASGSPNTLDLSGTGLGEPVVSNLQVSPRRLRNKTSRLDIAFDLSQAAKVRFILSRKNSPKEREACERERGRGEHCPIYSRVASKTVQKVAGANQYSFSALMPAGNYRLGVTAQNANGQSERLRARFRKP